MKERERRVPLILVVVFVVFVAFPADHFIWCMAVLVDIAPVLLLDVALPERELTSQKKINLGRKHDFTEGKST